MEKIKGKVVWKFDEHFNADLIVGSKNIGERNIEVLGKVFMADFDPDLVNRVRRGDILIAGRNFGYGHPHQQSIQSIKKVGISTVIAESFFPAWYRMAFFHAFPVVVCPNIAKAADVNQDLEVDLVTGKLTNISKSKTFQAEAVPPFLLDVLNSGGLVRWLMKQPLPNAKQ